jgi:hypothetical protein
MDFSEWSLISKPNAVDQNDFRADCLDRRKTSPATGIDRRRDIYNPAVARRSSRSVGYSLSLSRRRAVHRRWCWAEMRLWRLAYRFHGTQQLPFG